MNRTRSILFALALLMMTAGSTLAQIDIKGKPRTVPGELIIKFKGGTVSTAAVSTLQAAGITTLAQSNKLSLYYCKAPAGRNLDDVIQECEARPEIEYAEPNYRLYALENTSAPPVFPNDPRFSELWGMNQGNDIDIDAPEAWDVSTGSANVLVAIIDTGIDYNHEDLRDNMWTNPGETGTDNDGKDKRSNGKDDDNNGYTDDFRGWDFQSNRNDPFDNNDHGTHCAGIVGAVGNNGIGVVGVNWQVKLMALKFLGSDGSGTTADAVDAIIYATDNGAKVLSNSWGGGDASQALEDAIKYANQNGVLFIAAAGNSSLNTDQSANYPSNYDVANVVSVASSDQNENLSSFSNFGRRTVDLAAPGSSIQSARPGDRYQRLSGTSMATPHVAGACALVWAHYPNLQAHQVLVRVLGAVDRKPAYTFKMTTSGRLNAARMFSSSPIIANTTDWSFTDNTAGPYPISTQAVDDGAIRSVKLIYTLNGGSSDTLAMAAGQKDSYSAAISGQPLNTEINYFVLAEDDQGNKTQSMTYNFKITTDGDGRDDGGGGCCGSSAVALQGVDRNVKYAMEVPLNLAFFLLPVVMLRRRKKKRE